MGARGGRRGRGVLEGEQPARLRQEEGPPQQGPWRGWTALLACQSRQGAWAMDSELDGAWPRDLNTQTGSHSSRSPYTGVLSSSDFQHLGRELRASSLWTPLCPPVNDRVGPQAQSVPPWGAVSPPGCSPPPPDHHVHQAQLWVTSCSPCPVQLPATTQPPMCSHHRPLWTPTPTLPTGQAQGHCPCFHSWGAETAKRRDALRAAGRAAKQALPPSPGTGPSPVGSVAPPQWGHSRPVPGPWRPWVPRLTFFLPLPPASEGP